MRLRRNGLWRHRDFVRLWAGQTISVFGSLIGRAALSFTAVLLLEATPLQVALLSTASLLPGFLAGLVAGVWVDRLARRPILVLADLGRALALLTIPIAYQLSTLNMSHLYLVAGVTGLLSVFFDVAYEAYLPSLVGAQHVVEGNSKLAASASVAEVSGFGISGWLTQLLSGPFAIGIDALSFLVSAAFCARIRTAEPPRRPRHERDSFATEVLEGLRQVGHSSVLLTLAFTTALLTFSFNVYGTVFLIYTGRELGFGPAVLGMIWGIGGLTSLLGAVLAPHLSGRLGYGPAMISGLIFVGLSMFLIPLASGATLLAAVFMIVQQFGDGGETVFRINETSLRQTLAPAHVLGRVNGSMRFVALGATLLGSLVGGLLGQQIGARATLVAGATGVVLTALMLGLSPVRRVRSAALPA